MRYPGVNKIDVSLYIIVCPLQYFGGLLCKDIENYIKKEKNQIFFFFVRSKVILNEKGHIYISATNAMLACSCAPI